jgi:hypothetical protein
MSGNSPSVSSRLSRLALLTLLVAVPALAATYDEGKLDTAFFGGDREFHETDEIDYLWVKDGFSLDGHTLHFQEWPDPQFLGPKADERDEDDRRLARQMSGDMHHLFKEEWSGVFKGAETSFDKGDVVVTGRVVDVSTGSTAAKVLVGWGAGAGNATIDLKMTDKASGEVLLAMHHRVVSGTSWSDTNSKFAKWVAKAGKEADKAGGFAQLYAKGERRTK